MASITIQGVVVNVPDRYNTGHTCSDGEAQALQQVFAENVRNNTAKQIKEKVEAAGGTPVPDKVQDEIQKIVDEYANGYEFYVRTQRTADPIEALARRTAWEIIKDTLRKDPTIKISELSADDRNARVEKLLEANPKIRAFAEKQIKEQSKLLA